MIDSQAQPPGGRRAGCWPSPQSVRREQKSREAAAGLGLFLGERAVGRVQVFFANYTYEVCRPVCQDLCGLPFRSKDVHTIHHSSHSSPHLAIALRAQAHAHWPLYLEVLAQEAFEKLIPLWGKGLKEPTSTENC